MGKRTKKSRDTPTQKRTTGNVAVSFVDAWKRGMVFEGYTPLYQCPEVRMCVDIYSDLISSMTLHLMQNTSRGDVRITNELSRKLDIEPNRYMNRKAFIRHIVNVMLTVGEGNCVVYPLYNREGYLEELLPLNPLQVLFEDDNGWGYRIRYGDRVFQPDEVLHYRINPDPERPWLGTGMRMSIAEAVKSIRRANSTKGNLMESPVPSLIIKADGLSSDFETKEGRQELMDRFFDSQGNGTPWIIPAEAFEITQVKPLTMSDLAIKDGLELDKKTIAGVMGVPPYLVGVGNYNEAEQQNFINTRIMGMAQNIQQEDTRKLLYSHDLYFRFNPRSLYNYKLADLVNAGKEMVDRMAMRRNEWRDWVGLPPDADMDELLALENYIPADRLGDQKKLKGGENGGKEE